MKPLLFIVCNCLRESTQVVVVVQGKRDGGLSLVSQIFLVPLIRLYSFGLQIQSLMAEGNPFVFDMHEVTRNAFRIDQDIGNHM